MVSKCMHALTKLLWPYFDLGVQQFLYSAPLPSAMSDNPAPAFCVHRLFTAWCRGLLVGYSFFPFCEP